MHAKRVHLALFMALALSGGLAYGQGSLGSIPKKARTLADYEPRTLKEILALDSADVEDPVKDDLVSKQADLLPFRVSVIYTGSSRPISAKSRNALFRWARCCAGNPDQFTGPYDTEMSFEENGIPYWLAVPKKWLMDFEKELKTGQRVNLYLIRVAAGRTDGIAGSVLLVERYTRVGSPQESTCLMEPPYPLLDTPAQGFVALNQTGPWNDCRPTPKTWLRLPAKTFDLLVHADGPAGSGRYWTVTIALAKKAQRTPERGFCFVTSTVGWRTLQNFDRPLAWITDQDHDGKPELIIWDSFAMKGDQSMSGNFGLVAWIYQVDARGQFTIDWKLSRKAAGELAAAYRRPLHRVDAVLLQTREQAAQHLESFAAGFCKSADRGQTRTE